MTGPRLKPGSYDNLPIEVYHGDCCDGPSLSSTGARVCRRDPARYWQTSPLNPAFVEAERVAKEARLKDGGAPQPSAKFMRFAKGSAAHLMLLEPQLVSEGVSVIPADLLSSSGAVSTKAAKAFVQEQADAGRVVLKPDEWQRICDMADALGSNRRVMDLLSKGTVEQSHIWIDAQSGVYLKSRPDFTPDDPEAWIVDYKTTDHDDIDRWERAAVADHRLDIQAALQMWGASEARQHRPAGVVYIVQHTKTAQVAIRWIDRGSDAGADLLAAARQDLRRGINAFAECWNSGQWLGPWDEETEIAVPGFRKREIEAQLSREAAIFPGEYAA